MDESDADLVEQVRQGSRPAGGLLVERHLRGCRAVALAIVGELDGAEDVSQEAVVYAMERIDECREPARFGAWLRQIVRSRARNYVRDQRRRHHSPLEGVVATDRRPTPAEDAERADLRARLLSALATLPEHHREIVLLHDLEGWTHREIADVMDLPAGTVRSHLHHARRALRRQLGEPEQE
jgi:RNA polymerase sigma-70 factor (ECF subfamily)